MAVKVLINSIPKSRVSINSQKREVIRTVGIAAEMPGAKLRTLSDVDATDLRDNAALVYDSESDKFVVQDLPTLNGGTF